MLEGAERIECKVQMMANNTDYYYSCIIIRKLILFRYIYDTVQGGGAYLPIIIWKNRLYNC